MKSALVTGILGQDGSLMAEKILRETDYEVYGLCRRSSNPNLNNIKNISDNPRFHLVYGDVSDEISINSLVQQIKPDFLFNFAGFIFVGPSWETPDLVYRVNFHGVLNCLEAIRKFAPHCRFFSAGSSEEFAGGVESPQTINTQKIPNNHYGNSKILAGNLVQLYRKKYDIFAVHGILYNHESNRRSEDFVFPKICRSAIRISRELKSGTFTKPLTVGNLRSLRDWSAAEDIVDGIWLMVNNSEPKDYILSSENINAVETLICAAFSLVGLDKGHWVQDSYYLGPYLLAASVSKFIRDEHSVSLTGDSGPARYDLNWHPKYNFLSLVEKLVKENLNNQ